jgi:hypothetical protein
VFGTVLAVGYLRTLVLVRPTGRHGPEGGILHNVYCFAKRLVYKLLFRRPVVLIWMCFLAGILNKQVFIKKRVSGLSYGHI